MSGFRSFSASGHAKHSSRIGIALRCHPEHLGFDGQCLNCGYNQKAPGIKDTAERISALTALGFVFPGTQTESDPRAD